ncbi:hypothetical protein MJT46_007393 [Ovis ammon polii x Ovis aries]|nr:hypothetical protein MJT46_007393 [Ovis ammon polii x Ovis aries]
MSDASLLSAALSNFYHLALSDVFASLVKDQIIEPRHMQCSGCMMLQNRICLNFRVYGKHSNCCQNSQNWIIVEGSIKMKVDLERVGERSGLNNNSSKNENDKLTKCSYFSLYYVLYKSSFATELYGSCRHHLTFEIQKKKKNTIIKNRNIHS